MVDLRESLQEGIYRTKAELWRSENSFTTVPHSLLSNQQTEEDFEFSNKVLKECDKAIVIVLVFVNCKKAIEAV